MAKIKKSRSLYKIITEFAITFVIVSLILFVMVNFGALKNKFLFWSAKTFSSSGSDYFLSKVDGLGLDGDVIPPDDRLVIPKLGVNVPLLFPSSSLTADLLDNLRRGVLVYPGTAMPGQVGNTFIAGHSSENPWEHGQYKTVFSLINNLEMDDDVLIYYDKVKYDYKIDQHKIVSDKDLSVLEATKEPQLTLMTCWPIGTTAKRLIVTGHLLPAHTKKGSDATKDAQPAQVLDTGLPQQLPAVR